MILRALVKAQQCHVEPGASAGFVGDLDCFLLKSMLSR